jgi:hypothetical protein
MCNASPEPMRVIASGGMDIQIKESGHRIGKAKLSKHGSGPARDVSST